MSIITYLHRKDLEAKFNLMYQILANMRQVRNIDYRETKVVM